jgi:hypothetical protein
MVAACAEVTSLTDLRAMLAEAEAAYQRLMLGRQPRVIIDANGERVEFTSVSADKLRAYVLDLQRRIGALTGCLGGAMNTRPVRFVF